MIYEQTIPVEKEQIEQTIAVESASVEQIVSVIQESVNIIGGESYEESRYLIVDQYRGIGYL